MTREALADWQFKGVVQFGTSGTIVDFMSGSGTPEGSVTANVGSLFMRTDGGAGTTLYIKESGAGNTGWTPIASVGVLPFSRGGTVLNPNGAQDVYIWRAPYACTVTAVKALRSGGTGATVNARKNGASEHLASDLSLTVNQTWTDGGAVQNASYAAGDYLEIRVKSVAGTPAQIAIQVEFTKP